MGAGKRQSDRGLDAAWVWPYNRGMATPTIKSTYSLDLGTVRALETLARRWNVSKSEALRRAIQASAGGAPNESSRWALEALDEAQASLRLPASRARSWARSVQTERRATSRRREKPTA